MRLPFQVLMCYEANRHVALTLEQNFRTSVPPLVISLARKQSMLFRFSYLKLFSCPEVFSMEIKNFDKTRGKFFWKWNNIFPFKMKLIPWMLVQNIDKALKVSHLQATSLEILVINTKFLVTLATSWSQFRTLGCSPWLKSFLRITDVNKNIAYLIKVEF